MLLNAMMLFRFSALVLSAFFSLFFSQNLAFASSGKHVVIGYYFLENKEINHYPEAAGFPVSRITAQKAAMLTHINFSFMNINPAGECDLGEGIDRDKAAQVFADLMALKRRNHNLRVLFSLGGWAYSNDSSPTVGRYRDAAANAEHRQQLARSCIALMKRYDFDGIDIDWEYPRQQDAENFVALLAEIRRQLTIENKTRGQKKAQLTIAGAGDAGNLTRYYVQLPAIVAQLDYINLMTYDLNGVWQKQTNHNAHLFGDTSEPMMANPLREQKFTPDLSPAKLKERFPSPLANTVDAAVQLYLQAGIPANKIVLGVPFYGRAFFNVEPKNHGLYQAFVTESAEIYQGDPALLTGCDTCTQRKEPRMASYAEIQTMLAGHFGYMRYFSDQTKVPWLWQPEQHIFVSYDDEQSLSYKTAYIKQQGLAGAMFWHLAQDDEKASLLRTLDRSLNHDQACKAAKLDLMGGVHYPVQARRSKLSKASKVGC
ncbi:chitinase [Undibacterium sp. GrIS 1.2]